MSVGFGFSAGDFIAALNLVSNVIDALHETSKVSYLKLASSRAVKSNNLKLYNALLISSSQRLSYINISSEDNPYHTILTEVLSKDKAYQRQQGTPPILLQTES